ncbi:hypothetical protein FNF31_03884 [Cafeteria roenbergensis]|uniref:RNA helicase n=1 Tax=Cafeteria roenbergensis TaxID=33653 RepID=A0A5A8D087_CAFRO|nr:hypothetical protein FNF28_06398 [Cafeteria roenbergensis]KAA0161271.1 hypothetical protein FNF31_03884 [Cafeteria roenbergensis]
MSGSSLQNWVAASLHDVVGFSDPGLASFLVAQASRARSQDDVIAVFRQSDVPVTGVVRDFASRLFARAGKPAVSESELRARSYALVDDDDDDDDGGGGGGGHAGATAPGSAAAGSRGRAGEDGSGRRRKRHRGESRRRRRHGDDDGDDPEEGSTAGDAAALRYAAEDRRDEAAAAAAAASSADATAGGREGEPVAKRGKGGDEEEDEDDAEALKAFEARLRERDERKTRKVGDAGRIQAAEDRAAARRAMGEAERDEALPELRKASRRDYMRRREAQQLALLRDEVAFDEKLMATSTLSAAELRRYEANKRILALAESRVGVGEVVAAEEDRYALPSSTSLLEAKGQAERDKRMAVLKERYGDGAGSRAGAAAADGLGWEAQKLGAAIGRAGAAVAEAAGGGAQARTSASTSAPSSAAPSGTTGTVRGIGGGEWGLVFEGGIDFVSSSAIKGISPQERERIAQEEKELRAGARGSSSSSSSSSRGPDAGASATGLDASVIAEEAAKVDAELAELQRRAGGGRPSAAEAALEAAKTARTAREEMQRVRDSLPIFAYREELLQAVSEYQVMVVVGETGSGKTTQIPQYLHEVGYTKLGRVGCTQPRRVAAMSVAARVAQEMGVPLGGETGYQIRFEDCTSDRTVIKYMTDGMLLREFLAEPDLRSYSVLIIDEAHERSLHTDVLLGLIKDVARYRDDLKVIIASATVDAGKFSAYFDDAPIFNIPGRPYDIDILYTKAPEANYVEAAIVTALQVHVSQPPPGDILVFCTGQDEIESAIESITERTRALGGRIKELIALPLYSALPADQQARIFEPTPEGARKVIFSTNIAETSLTIDGIKYVIDAGFVKQNSFNPRTGVESLQVVPVSKAAAQQRSGRAGRTGPGTCFRLFTPWSFENELPDDNVPEIQRTNLASVVLMLKSLGIHNLIEFDFMDPPPTQALKRALNQLYALGALNQRGELTRLGRRMAEFPTDPLLSKMLLAAEKFRCVDEALTVAAMLDVQGAVFFTPRDRKRLAQLAHQTFARGAEGDHGMLLQVFSQWEESGFSKQWCKDNFVQDRSMRRARDVREQLLGLCERVEIEPSSSPDDSEALAKAITAGYFFNAARLNRSGNYRTTKTAHTVAMHPSSILAPKQAPRGADKDKDAEARKQLGLPSQEDALPARPPPEWVVYHELVETSREYMRCITPIKPAWLTEIAPHYYKPSDVGTDDDGAAPVIRGKAKPSAAASAAASRGD